MLQMKAEIIDGAKVIEALHKFKGNVAKKLEMFFKREGALMEGEIKHSLGIGGRLAERGPRGGKRVLHSPPGSPPYLQSGRLRASIGYILEIIKTTGDFILDIGAVRKGKGEVKYAHDLEKGRSNMAPRPYLMPVVMKHVNSWERFLKMEISKIKT